MTDIPQWAVERALELLSVDDADGPWTTERHGTLPAVTAFARYIAAHEEAPVDHLYEALKAVVELGRYDTREQTDLLRRALALRGLKIVEEKP